MHSTRFLERALFYTASRGARRRELRFLLLAIFLGGIIAVMVGAILYSLNHRGRI